MMRSVSSFFALAAFAAEAQGVQAFELKSPDIAEGKTIDMKHVYDSFGCTGDNVSPELSWSEPPAGTKSLAVLVHDPDGTGLRDLGEAVGLWPSQRNRFAWSRWQGASWGVEPPFDNKLEWGLCASKY